MIDPFQLAELSLDDLIHLVEVAETDIPRAALDAELARRALALGIAERRGWWASPPGTPPPFGVPVFEFPPDIPDDLSAL